MSAWSFILQPAEKQSGEGASAIFTLGVMLESQEDGTINAADIDAGIRQIKNVADIGDFKLIDKPVAAAAPTAFQQAAPAGGGRTNPTGGFKGKGKGGDDGGVKKHVVIDMVGHGVWVKDGKETPVINFYTPLTERSDGGFSNQYPVTSVFINKPQDLDAFKAHFGFDISELPAVSVSDSEAKKRDPDIQKPNQREVDLKYITVSEKTEPRKDDPSKTTKRANLVAYGKQQL